MVLTIALLLAFQLAGSAVTALFGLPVPGPVMGMVFFLFALMVKDNLLQKTLPVVNVLLAHFALLFVLPITASIVISSVLAMAATALTIRWVMKLMHIEG